MGDKLQKQIFRQLFLGKLFDLKLLLKLNFLFGSLLYWGLSDYTVGLLGRFFRQDAFLNLKNYFRLIFVQKTPRL
jgi:hypothetical protein